MRSSTQILTLFGIFCCLVFTDAIYVKQENSLFGPFEEGQGNLVHWDLTGNAHLAGPAIRLTSDEPDKNGAIWNNFPVYQNDWEFHLHFHIHGKGVHLNGDGMAFWYVRDPLEQGHVFGSRDYFTGLGIFIDTVEDTASPHNHRHPYISAMVNNGSLPYYHDQDGTWNQIGGCHVPVRNLEWPTKMAISYINNALTIFVDTTGSQVWQECLQVTGVHLPTGYFFGISASTGEYSDNHDVVSITTLDGLVEGKAWEDRSFMLPSADFIEVPPKHLEPEAPSEEELQNVEEEIKVEVKREVKDDHQNIDHQNNDHINIDHHNIDHKSDDHKVDEGVDVAPSVPFTRKALYVLGVAVILLVAINLFRKYTAQRRERMQKRLY